MAQLLRAETIAIGSELLLGGRLDTNSLFLADELVRYGVEVRFKSVVGDHPRDMVSALQVACGRSQLVLLTGGLGSTEDDLTREAVATLTRRPLRFRPSAFAALEHRLAEWRRPVTLKHRKQARIPTGADVLDNPVGSAPGFLVRWHGAVIAALPGVPGEAKAMFRQSLIPLLFGPHGLWGSDSAGMPGVLERRVLHTTGYSELEIERRVELAMASDEQVELGILASPLGVDITLTVRMARPTRSPKNRTKASSAFTTIEDVDRLVADLRMQLGSIVYGQADETMEDIVGRQLAERGLILALAESCTGGLIGHRLTQVPGSSAYLDRGAVCYSNAAKADMLGVPARVISRYGAVSAEVAQAMAKGMRQRSRADIGLSVTGIAGPGGATATKPVGLVFVGVDMSTGCTVERYEFTGDRQTIKLKASQAALNLLRLRLTGQRVNR
jgi:nicotinamide-nucleotide amidase